MENTGLQLSEFELNEINGGIVFTSVLTAVITATVVIGTGGAAILYNNSKKN